MGCTSSQRASANYASFGEDSFSRSYKVGSKLGRGEFGTVRVAKCRSTKAVRAVKIINLSDADGNIKEDELEHVQAEAKIMQYVCEHPNCVEMLASFQEQSLFYILMEKCDASILDQFEEMTFASDAYLRRLFREMLMGIAHVHGLNVVHRDIKPDNFLLGGRDGETVKLCDFGMAQLLPSKGYFTSSCGTAPYMSPELVARKGYDFKTDVWSLGVTGYLLLYGDFPYRPRKNTPQAMKDLILLGSPAPQFASASRFGSMPSLQACDFVQRLMTRDQKERCTAEEALLSPFTTGEGTLPVLLGHSDNSPSHVWRTIGDGTPTAAKKADAAATAELDNLPSTRQQSLSSIPADMMACQGLDFSASRNASSTNEGNELHDVSAAAIKSMWASGVTTSTCITPALTNSSQGSLVDLHMVDLHISDRG
jgi:serine/threonine protein kinase